MKPGARILVGDCLHVLKTLADNSVDAIVTDPPYGLTANKKGGSGVASVNLDSPYGRARIGTGNGPGGFMGMKWDSDVPSVEVWTECLRVLKPGGHLLAFAGTRTQHRMAVRIEDAGFEIRDMIAWVYGSGFPKSMDVQKAIDRAQGVTGTFGDPKSAAHAGWIDRGRLRGEDGHDGYQRPWMDDADAVDRAARQYIGGSEVSRQWAGWGSALKPALEPITVARKPLIGTVAENVLAHGTGALNVDGCRIKTIENLNGGAYANQGGRSQSQSLGSGGMNRPGAVAGVEFKQPVGRWPANLIHDGSDEVLAAFPDAPGQSGADTGSEPSSKTRNTFGLYNARPVAKPRDDSGSAARFFYCAKASKADREAGNSHPTVKPTDLMRYLVRLVTPPGGTVLDPFTGSGSTGKAAVLEGFEFVGIELSEDYAEIARSRIERAEAEVEVEAPKSMKPRTVDDRQLDIFSALNP